MSNNFYQKLLSESKKALEDRNEELEAQHEELTAAVEALAEKNKYLEKTKKELEDRNKEIDQIIYRTSHDLKSPITSLEGIFSLVLTDDKVDLEDYIDLAQKSTLDMKERIRMLRRYSRALLIDVKYTAIDFDKLWEELKLELAEISGYDKVKISFRNTLTSEIKGDYDRIIIMLFNLIKNSIDYRASDTPKVEVYLSERQDKLLLQVIDNGLGVCPDIQRKIFNMFYRGTNKSKGAGLGLYLCERIANMHKGDIRLVSSEDVGTTITVSFPK